MERANQPASAGELANKQRSGATGRLGAGRHRQASARLWLRSYFRVGGATATGIVGVGDAVDVGTGAAKAGLVRGKRKSPFGARVLTISSDWNKLQCHPFLTVTRANRRQGMKRRNGSAEPRLE